MAFAMQCLGVVAAVAAILTISVPAAFAVTFTLEACNDGTNEIADCTPLYDNLEVSQQSVEAGEYKYYHWVMTDFSITDVPDDERPSITFRVSPCTGNAHLYVRPVTLPFPSLDDYRFNSSKNYEVNAVSIQLFEAQYFVSVYGEEDSTFSIVAQMDDVFPLPGADGAITAEARTTEEIVLEGETMSMTIKFTAADTPSGLYEYYVYAVPNTGDCADGQNGDCILTTECGLKHVETSTVGPITDAVAGQEVTVDVPGLEQNVEYTFNVQARRYEQDNGGNTVATYSEIYTATTGTPEFRRESKVHDDNTIIIIASVSGGVIVLLVVLIVWAKMRLNKAFRRRQAKKKAQLTDQDRALLTNLAAPTGKPSKQTDKGLETSSEEEEVKTMYSPPEEKKTDDEPKGKTDPRVI